MSEGKQCIFIKSNGERCNAISLSDSDLCWAHEPALEEKRHLAKSQGGRQPEYIVGIPIKIATINDVMDLISEVVFNLRSLPLTINQARALLNAAETAMHAIEIIGFEDRLSALEEIYNEDKKH